MTYQRRFEEHLFHAFTLGVGGYVERDKVSRAIPLGAPLALSVAGGSGTSCHRNYDFIFTDKNRQRASDFRLKVKEIVSEVKGEEFQDKWVTTARSELIGLDINDGVVTAERVYGTLMSEHLKRSSRDEPKAEGSITAEDSDFEDLRVKGVPVRYRRDEVVGQITTHGRLREFISGKDPEARDFCDRNFLTRRGNPENDEQRYICDMEGFQNDQYLRYSIFRDVGLDGYPDGVTRHCYSLWIRGFGRLYIGEVIVSHDSKHLNMLRFDLGCEDCGGGTAGSPAVNGVTMP